MVVLGSKFEVELVPELRRRLGAMAVEFEMVFRGSLELMLGAGPKI